MQTQYPISSNFHTEIIGNTVVIYDLDIGGRSVTNDIENVLEYIKQSVDISNKLVIYQDSDKYFDGVCISRNGKFSGFYPIHKNTLNEAFEVIGEKKTN